MTEQLQAGGRIVVGTDLSHNADHAVDWAAERAVEVGAPLLVVLALPEVIIPRRVLPHHVLASDQGMDEVRQRASARLAELGDRVREAHEGLQVETRLLTGRASYVLAGASKSAEMVVVGARGRSDVPASVRALGGTADAVTTHAHGPVAVIRPDTKRDAEGPVVVGVDDSPEAMAAVSFAVAEAVRRGTGLVAVHVWDATLMLMGGAGLWSGDGTQISAALETMIDEVMRPYLDEHPDLQYRTLVLSGRAPNVLAEAAREASVLVIGSRGRHGFAGQLLGSTSRDVLREAECPVVVVRT